MNDQQASRCMSDRFKKKMGSVSLSHALGLPEISEYHRVPDYSEPENRVCWWDTEPFEYTDPDQYPIHFPVRISDTRFRAANPSLRCDKAAEKTMEMIVEGIFCSYNCALAYGRAHEDQHVRAVADANMMAYMVRCHWHGFDEKGRRSVLYKGKLPFEAAIKPQVALEKFGGRMTIERYRQFFNDTRHFVYTHSEYTRIVPSQFGVFVEDLDRLIVKPRSIKETYFSKEEVFEREKVAYSKRGLAKDHLIPRTKKEDFKVCAVEDIDHSRPDGKTFIKALQYSCKVGSQGRQTQKAVTRPMSEKRRRECTKAPRAKKNKF